MHKPKLYAAFLAAAFAAVAACAVPAVAQDKDYTPHVGQEGKDVIWVPTPQALVERMLDMAKLTAKDIHYDLGSGDRSEERRVGKECRCRGSWNHGKQRDLWLWLYGIPDGNLLIFQVSLVPTSLSELAFI